MCGRHPTEVTGQPADRQDELHLIWPYPDKSGQRRQKKMGGKRALKKGGGERRGEIAPQIPNFWLKVAPFFNQNRLVKGRSPHFLKEKTGSKRLKFCEILEKTSECFKRKIPGNQDVPGILNGFENSFSII